MVFSWSILTTQILSGTMYLDPGSGSFIIQVLIGAFMAGLLMVKIYWRKIMAFFKKDKPDVDPEEHKN